MSKPYYTYMDPATGKIRHTRGYFETWTRPTGPLTVPYAIFKTPKTRVCVPYYCLTEETKAKLPPRTDKEVLRSQSDGEIEGDKEMLLMTEKPRQEEKVTKLLRRPIIRKAEKRMDEGMMLVL